MIENIIRSILVKLHIISPPEIRMVELLRKKGVVIGDNVHIYNSSVDGNYGASVTIGNNVTITGTCILAHDASTKKALGYTKVGRVHIGNKVFIGYGSVILPETVIGDNVIIGAGSIVRGKVDSNSVVVGNPAKKVCSYSEYIDKNRQLLNEGYISENGITSEVIAMMDKKRIFVE